MQRRPINISIVVISSESHNLVIKKQNLNLFVCGMCCNKKAFNSEKHWQVFRMRKIFGYHRKCNDGLPATLMINLPNDPTHWCLLVHYTVLLAIIIASL